MRRRYYRLQAENQLQHRCRCQECDNKFRAARPDAVYCCAKCKNAAAYRRRKAKEEAEKIEQSLARADAMIAEVNAKILSQKLNAKKT